MPEIPKTQAEKIFEYFQWGFIILFAVPTFLIMASWNSLPGQPMYEVKRSFEQALLFAVKPSYAAEASLNVQFTQRRFNEAKVLLANDQSTEGLAYLSQQIRATKAVIERAPDKTKQKQIARQYIDTLRSVSKELTAQKQTLASAPSGRTTTTRTTSGRTVYPTYTPRPTRPPYVPPAAQPTATPRPLAVAPTAMPTLPPGVIPTPTPIDQPQTPEDEVDDIQEEIEDTIDDLEAIAADNADAPPPAQEAAPTPTPTITQQQQIMNIINNQNDDDDEEDDNRGNGRGNGNGNGNGNNDGPFEQN